MASSNGGQKKAATGNDRRNIWLLIATTLLLIGSIVLFMPPQEKINQGLDIQGGLSVVLTATSTDGDAITDETMEASRAIIENRVNALGASEAVVQVQGTNQILVQIPGLSDTETALNTIGKTGNLEFARLDSFTDSDVVSKITSGQYENEKTVTDDFGNSFKTGEINHLTVEEGTYTPIVTGANIQRVTVGRASEASIDYAVDIALDSEGSAAFAQASRDLVADHGQIVIILDHEVQSAPAVQSEIPNGQVQITGNYSLTEAQALQTVLQSGSLPVSFQYSQSQVVGPTLGQDALHAGVIVALLGILLVMVYLLFFYKGLGIITAAAMVVFATFYLGILALLSRFGMFSLSLSGIAGIVLTIGMAADSSVLTVERFREEVRMGRSIRAASITGVRHAIQTSIDADLVSLVSAFALFFLGAASVKGFGLTLALGIICDIVMMLLFKAPLVRLLAPRTISAHPGFWNVRDGQIASEKFSALGAVLGVSAGEAEVGEAMDSEEVDRVAAKRAGEDGASLAQAVHDLKGRFIKHDFNFLGHRKVLLIISACLVVASIAVVGIKGMTFGIEFVGGTSITFHETGDIALEDMRSAFAAAGEPDAVIQTTVSDGELGFLVRTTTTDAQDATAAANQVADQFGLTTDNFEVTTIGPDWGSSVVNQSLIAFFVSIVLIIIYIAIRFEFKMGFTAIAALLHDLIIVIGVYALFGREFTPNAVAALLTILGYSLYDTVVVFHRIQDNVKELNIKCSFMTMANHSLNQVFIRSINTTLTSLIPVIGMLLFGGETLKDFAFAMTIGLIIGCYSSIAVATPLVAIWQTREPRYAKIAKKFGERIGAFEFQREGSTVSGSLGNSKAARKKTAQVKAANAQAALAAHADEQAADDALEA
ncbi:MAG: protein translocase subunit SecD, partial [Eggerthellaceae bacterium]|nr:protein translocase subunit SecD [Eggerthellaceae bacterium]